MPLGSLYVRNLLIFSLLGTRECKGQLNQLLLLWSSGRICAQQGAGFHKHISWYRGRRILLARRLHVVCYPVGVDAQVNSW